MASDAWHNPVYLANMAQLWRHDPRLAQRIDDLPIDASFEVERTRAGGLTARVRTPDGRDVYLHSRHDPAREAADFCKALPMESASCVLLFGLGLGHHLPALVDRFGDGTAILVSEPDLVTIKTALAHTDFSKLLAGGRLEIIQTLDKGTLHQRLNRYAMLLVLGTCLAAPPGSRQRDQAFHDDCAREILDYAAFAKMSVVTLVRNAVITCRNIANNLPAYVCSPPTDILRGLFKGRPAILLAAGPSLARNIDQLRELQDRAVLIAAQTTLRPLLARGIRPHFVTSLDYSEMSRQFFEGIDIPDETILVAEPKASWHVIDSFKGGTALRGRRIILLDNEFACECVGADLARRAHIPPGATVMHLAFYLAEFLGCDPIIFVGQDLGFTGHCYYTPGVAMHQAWQPELGRFGTLETKEWERIARHKPILRKLTDIHDCPIYTDEQMFTYLQQFERDFAQSAARVIDATEGGVRKAGTTVITLQEAAQAHCREALSADRLRALKTPWYEPARLAIARDRLTTRRNELSRFRALCDETMALLKELDGLTGEPARFNKRIVRLDEIRTLVQQQHTLFSMVVGVSQLGQLQKLSADQRLLAEGLTGAEHARRMLQRDKQLVESLLEGCGELERILDQALARFDEAREGST